jgi:glutamate dehydrogenase
MLSKIVDAIARSMLVSDDLMGEGELADAAAFLLDHGAHRQEDAVVRVVTDRSVRRSRIAIVCDDIPFLVASVVNAVEAVGLEPLRVLHPSLWITRDAGGTLIDIQERDTPEIGRKESLIYVETQQLDDAELEYVEKCIRHALADVQAVVSDRITLKTLLEEDTALVQDLGEAEGAALLKWLNEGKFTLLGHINYEPHAGWMGGQGILRGGPDGLLAVGGAERLLRATDEATSGAPSPSLPILLKSNWISRVHRSVPIDLLAIPKVDGATVTGLSVHAGLWTSAALASAPDETPVLRSRLARLADNLALGQEGHRRRLLIHSVTSLPHDILVAVPKVEFERLIRTVMSLIDRPRPKLVLVESPLDRHAHIFVWLPRDMIATEVRLAIEGMLVDATGVAPRMWTLEIGGDKLARLQFLFDMNMADVSAISVEERLNFQIQDMLRGWRDAVEQALADSGHPVPADRFVDAFPLSYRASHGPVEAAADIGILQALFDPGEVKGGERSVRLYRLANDKADRFRIKVYQRVDTLILSDVVPALENFGFRVLDTFPTPLEGPEGRVGMIHDFLLALPGGQPVGPMLARASTIVPALSAVLDGVAEDDAFNRLVTTAGLSSEEAHWLRACYRYLRQAGMSYSVATTVDALAKAADVTRGLVDRFRAAHQPGLACDKRIEAADAAIADGLTRVSSINDDRLLRALWGLLTAILRTNAFSAAAAEALAFKFDSACVSNLPRPLPWREIFVYSPRVEGIHLRSGPVARGGLRWSDRRDDFRTEILGLMKAQRVKNAVIVPAGAKGGFYPKRLPDIALDREGWLAEGRAAYEIFIRALLSITDNIVDGAVCHPESVVVRDGEDPYLVVAADKGTATFSDIANALAERHEFWLGDAFASGGSKGYDHKAIGITAKGAWLSVQRHFRELGIDVQSEAVSAVGVGDMSGDVFGNGMLLSQSIKLVAAFDHRHIFLDPSPDPSVAWRERNRLFQLPCSSWADYDSNLISLGGGVFSRSAKEIVLTPQVQSLLGLAAGTIDPDGLISAILKAPVDLLWFGGIGTYAKATSETDAQVGDPANNAIRVNGADLRARVIGEGANLGITQPGRIEYALSGAGGVGGRVNTDFIDNSAGVNCSDAEVNIKIALAAAMQDGRLTEDARIRLLAAMTEQVAEIVLENNRLQALGLSIAQAEGAAAVPGFLRLITYLETNAGFDRGTEGIPDTESLLRRMKNGVGLTRPELAVLLSSAKLAFQDALESSDVAAMSGQDDDLEAAFPALMQRDFASDIRNHRLRQQILATRTANRLINRLGFLLPFELAEREGLSLAELARGFVIAEGLFDLPALWTRIDTSDIDEDGRFAAFHLSARAVCAHIRALCRLLRQKPEIDLQSYRAAVLALDAGFYEATAPDPERIGKKVAHDLEERRVPADIARQVGHLFDLDGAIAMIDIAWTSGHEPNLLVAFYNRIGTTTGLDWACAMAQPHDDLDEWERRLSSKVRDDLLSIRRDYVACLSNHGSVAEMEAAVARWSERQASGIAELKGMCSGARDAATMTKLAYIALRARDVLAFGE